MFPIAYEATSHVNFLDYFFEEIKEFEKFGREKQAGPPTKPVENRTCVTVDARALSEAPGTSELQARTRNSCREFSPVRSLTTGGRNWAREPHLRRCRRACSGVRRLMDRRNERTTHGRVRGVRGVLSEDASSRAETRRGES